mgnify:CR=1 FL=1
MAIKRDAALVRHYAAQLGLTVNEYARGKTRRFVFLHKNADGQLTPAGINAVDYDILGIGAALAWLAGYAAAKR